MARNKKIKSLFQFDAESFYAHINVKQFLPVS